MDVAIEVNNLQHAWQDKPVLSIDKLVVKQGESLFVAGPSGAGKSTLLGLLAGIHPVQMGNVSLLGESLNSMNGARRDAFRAAHIGYVFQQLNLLSYMSVLDNVMLADTFKPRRLRQPNGKQRAQSLLNELQIPAELFNQRSAKLSVGQQQRVAIARALFGKPEIIIADEPTSALDHANAAAFMQLLLRQVEQSGATLVYVSHDESLRLNFDQVVQLTGQGGVR